MHDGPAGTITPMKAPVTPRDPGEEPAPDRPPWNEPGLADRPEFRTRIAWVESLPENQSGADKSWVERSDREFREHYAKAIRVR